MSTSQNGWPANDRTLIKSFTIPGTEQRIAIRDGDVATVLLYVAGRFHREVEPIHVGWCWGYAERNIRGSSTTLSNHASGTAIDLNAPAHPLGTDPESNYSPTQLAAAHQILNTRVNGLRIGDVVRWGADYTGRKDGMHWEINADVAAVARLAAAIRKPKPITPRPQAKPKAPSFPLPRGYYFGPKSGPAQSVSGYYSHRSQLAMWQAQMKRRGWTIGVDGLFGDQTEQVVKAFQKEKRLGVDGKIGPKTWAAAWTASVT